LELKRGESIRGNLMGVGGGGYNLTETRNGRVSVPEYIVALIGFLLLPLQKLKLRLFNGFNIQFSQKQN
jgi:hypothetical protein